MIDIEKLVRPNIKRLKPYTSARDSYLSGTLLDANENSLGSVIENDLELNRYPDPAQTALRNKLGGLINIHPENLFFGVGSDEVIDLLIRIFCEPGKDNVIIPEPTYGMYKVSSDINNVETVTVELDINFQPDADTIMSKVNENTKMLFLCSPNNPTANILDKEKVTEIIKRFKGIIVVDEAYVDFDSDSSFTDLVKEYNNLVILRTFSKAWGLAGIRCGYCIADKGIINFLFKVKAPYNMNKLTANAVLNALDNYKKRDEYINDISNERKRISEELKKIKKVENVFDSNANFILFRVENASEIYRKLAERGVIIRDRSSQLNLENCLRVSIGTKDENNLFLDTLSEVL